RLDTHLSSLSLPGLSIHSSACQRDHPFAALPLTGTRKRAADHAGGNRRGVILWLEQPVQRERPMPMPLRIILLHTLLALVISITACGTTQQLTTPLAPAHVVSFDGSDWSADDLRLEELPEGSLSLRSLAQ